MWARVRYLATLLGLRVRAWEVGVQAKDFGYGPLFRFFAEMHHQSHKRPNVTVVEYGQTAIQIFPGASIFRDLSAGGG